MYKVQLCFKKKTQYIHSVFMTGLDLKIRKSFTLIGVSFIWVTAPPTTLYLLVAKKKAIQFSFKLLSVSIHFFTDMSVIFAPKNFNSSFDNTRKPTGVLLSCTQPLSNHKGQNISNLLFINFQSVDYGTSKQPANAFTFLTNV